MTVHAVGVQVDAGTPGLAAKRFPGVACTRTALVGAKFPLARHRPAGSAVHQGVRRIPLYVLLGIAGAGCLAAVILEIVMRVEGVLLRWKNS